MSPPVPPEEITQLMHFIARKSENVKSPMNISKLCKQFKEETGTSASEDCLKRRIISNRCEIHKMNEFDMDTKVKMMFALSAPVDPKFLIELRKVADVEVDDQQRIIKYKKKEDGMEMSAKHMKLSMEEGEQRDRSIIQFLIEKLGAVDVPISDTTFLKEFKETTGCQDSMKSLTCRYRRVRNTIFEFSGINKNTKVKMMFISKANLSEGILKKLRKDADVEVGKEGRITKYKANDGSLELEKDHKISNEMPFRKSNIQCSKRMKLLIEREQRDKSIIQFLIEKSKMVDTPMVDALFMKDFKETTGCVDSIKLLKTSYRRVRNKIFELPGIDKNTKIRMMFISNVQISDFILKELQKDAYVEVDVKGRIRKYKAYDGSLELKGNHSMSVKMETSRADIKRRWLESISMGRKRARGISVEDDDVEKSLKVEDDREMDFDHAPPSYQEYMHHISIEKKPESLMAVKIEVPGKSSTSTGGDHFLFDYDPPTYEEDTEHIPVEKKLENLIEVKAEIPEQPSTSYLKYHYGENLEHILTEPKPENL